MIDELDETTIGTLLDRTAKHSGTIEPPRSYPGYPRWKLPPHKPARFRVISLDRAMLERRSSDALASDLPSDLVLSRILTVSHGVSGPSGRGPVPSAGGLQALELYLATWGSGWLPTGWYHFDRASHELVQIAAGLARDRVCAIVPSLAIIDGGALAWIVVGDRARVVARYGDRADRFLLLEAGHLMHGLCLASVATGLCTVPLGGFFDRAISRALQLPRTDRVLYAGVLGKPAARSTAHRQPSISNRTGR
jgi:SagB-type dehydrogenase family enzyme